MKSISLLQDRASTSEELVSEDHDKHASSLELTTLDAEEVTRC